MPSDSLYPDPLEPQPASPTARRQVELELVDKVRGWIDLHLHEEISWERLVRISGLSAFSLHALFLRHVKTTPMMYIRAQRAQRTQPGGEAPPPPVPATIAPPPGEASPDP